ncbi:MAG: hypothetical protein ABJP48_10960 [Erythrobacter sp.]
MGIVTRINTAFTRANNVLAGQSIWVVAIAALAIIQTTLIITHIPWADEWQAALIALEAPDLAVMMAWLRYEGHPPLWYLLLRAIGSIAPPDAVLWIAALLCAIVVQAIILFACPFGRLERLLLASSQFVLFEFLTISRGTTLGIALIMVAMLAWSKAQDRGGIWRWTFWIVMALLPSVDFFFGVISGVFLIMKWRERDVWWPGISLWLAGGAIAAWSILPAPDIVSAFEAFKPVSGQSQMMDVLFGWIRKIGSLPFPFQGGILPQWNSPVYPIESLAWIGMLALCAVLTRAFPWNRLLIFGFFGFTFAFSLAVYPIGLRHLMLGAFLLLLMVWRQWQLEPQADALKSAVLRGWLALLAICGLASSTMSAVIGFDAAPKALAEIERLGLSDKHWIMLPEWRSAGIAGRSNITFGRPGEQCDFTFVRWDKHYSELASKETFTAMLEREIAQHGRSYFMSDISFNDFPADLIAPLAEIPAGYDGVDYNLYIIGRNAAEKPVSLPRCHSINTAQSVPIP